MGFLEVFQNGGDDKGEGYGGVASPHLPPAHHAKPLRLKSLFYGFSPS